MKQLKVRLTFTESILGTASANEDVYRDFIGSKSPDAASVDDEVAALGADAVVEKGKTVFPKLPDGTPFLYDYQIKGFFKDTCGGLRKVKGSKSEKIKAFKKEIDKLIFVEPRCIPFENYGEIGECQRPLRAQTMQGERVSLSISDEIAAGAQVEFTVLMLSDEHEDAVREWLDYGRLSGIGQWRNSGKGRFTYEVLYARSCAAWQWRCLARLCKGMAKSSKELRSVAAQRLSIARRGKGRVQQRIAQQRI